MNYQHSYHAGNFADVIKHSILVVLLQALLRKEKPFCYMDTHAGSGSYDLQAAPAQKTREYESGILRVLAQKDCPQELGNYLLAVQAVAPSYPGSPRIARQFLRSCDRMQLAELQPQAFSLLKREFHQDKQVIAHNIDGYQALKAWLPPNERRGLVLIDPPYEKNNEFQQILAGLQAALARWATGIYAIWYPLKSPSAVQGFQQNLPAGTLIAELSIYPEDAAFSLYGCGMAIINPPWQLDQQLAKLLPWLWQVLSPQQQGTWRLNISG